jgi:hypothetical protein
MENRGKGKVLCTNNSALIFICSLFSLSSAGKIAPIEGWGLGERESAPRGGDRGYCRGASMAGTVRTSTHGNGNGVALAAAAPKPAPARAVQGQGRKSRLPWDLGRS